MNRHFISLLSHKLNRHFHYHFRRSLDSVCAEAGSWFALCPELLALGRCCLLLVVFLACCRLSDSCSCILRLFCSAASLFDRFCLFVFASTSCLRFQPENKTAARTQKAIRIFGLLGAACVEFSCASGTLCYNKKALYVLEIRTIYDFSRSLEPPAARAPAEIVRGFGGDRALPRA